MRLGRLLGASVALTMSGTAMAGGFVVNLEPGSAGIVRGHVGLHAVDARTNGALVRLVAPGLEIGKRGGERAHGHDCFAIARTQIAIATVALMRRSRGDSALPDVIAQLATL